MRSSGILLPVFSLPGRYGMGTLGQEARDFADFLAASGQTVWQILPVGPTGYGASPYQSDSAFAGNPYFIDPGQLCKEGLVTKAECEAAVLPAGPVDYTQVEKKREALLRAAAARFLADPPPEWESFCQKETWWVDDYAMYKVARAQNAAPVCQWPKPLRCRWGDAMGSLWFDNQPEINYHKFLQFEFARQWKAFKAYVNGLGIRLLGDLPIYVSPDSADVWARPDLFCLDEEGRPASIAGVPPDAFSADGQLWGNPIYDWAAHEREHYAWWVRRIGSALSQCDVLRIDHFRGFESYWAVPAGEKNAVKGAWLPGPGGKLFGALEEKLGANLPIVAEDLGILTDGVRRLLQETGYPGMKILQFAFDSGAENEYLPHHHLQNSVVYTGTHDNTTVKDWFATMPKKTVEHARTYLDIRPGDDPVWAFIRAAQASCADLCVVPMADLLGLGAEGRINTPSTVGKNWDWRLEAGAADAALAKKLADLGRLYGRC